MEYVDDKKFSSNTPLGMLGEALNVLDDVEAESEYDALLYFDSIYEYLNDISSLNLDENDDDWVMQGLDTSKVDVATDWKPPARAGLDNSSRIV
eukprot:gene19715-25643_t